MHGSERGSGAFSLRCHPPYSTALRKRTRLDTQEEDPMLFDEDEIETNVRPLKSPDAE